MPLSSLTLTLVSVEPHKTTARSVTWPATEESVLTALTRLLTGEPVDGWIITEFEAKV